MSEEYTLKDVVGLLHVLTAKADDSAKKIDALTETVQDIIEVVTVHSEKMDARLDGLGRTSATKDDIRNMATKDDLHTLQDNLYNQLLPVDKKTNVRVDTVVEILDKQNVITPAQTAHLLSMEPFPRMVS